MMDYNFIMIGGFEAVLKEDNGLLRNLEIDGGISKIKGGYVNSVLKFSGGEVFGEMFKVSPIKDIVISVGYGEVFRGICKLVRMNLDGEGYGYGYGDFEVKVIGENGIWFEALRGVSLRDLDWGYLDYNVGSVLDGMLVNPLGSKYGFGLGKWGKWKNDNGGSSWMVDMDEATFVGFIPFIVKNGFKKIGYNVDSVFFNSEYVAGMCMPFAMRIYDEEWLKERYDLEVIINSLKITTFGSGGSVILGNADGINKNSSTSVYSRILNNPLKGDGSGLRLFRDLGRPSWYQQTPQVPSVAPNRYSYECVMSGSYEVFLENENYSDVANMLILSMEVLVGCPVNGLPSGGTSKGVVNINDRLIINLSEGDIVDFNFFISSPFASTLEFKDMRWGIRWARRVEMSRRWQIGGLMPKWSIGDILLGLVHGCNLKFETDEMFKKVVIEPADEWRDNNGFVEGFYKYWDGEKYEGDIRDKIKSKRLINRVSLSRNGEKDRKDLVSEKKMSYSGGDGTVGGVEDKYKIKLYEGGIVFNNPDSKEIEDENPFFVGTYQIYDVNIKGLNSEFTPIVPYLGNEDYYEEISGGGEREAMFEDVPRLLVFGGLRVYVSGYVKGGTVRMNGNNDYPLAALWTVNYNDEEGSDFNVSYGDDFNVKGNRVIGLVRRFYLKDFLRIERGDKYKYWVEWGLGSVSFRDSYDMEGKRLILKKVEGYDGSVKKFCKTFFDEDIFVLGGDLDKIKLVSVKGVGSNL